MKNEFDAARLDVKAFAQDGGELSGQDALGRYERLMAETRGQGGDSLLGWTASGELKPVLGAPGEIWLHLRAEATLPLTCQRCLGPVQWPVVAERSFRFVADEAAALAQDDEAEEDLLVLSRAFDLRGLIEDEILMALPLVPRHDICPTDVKLAVADEAFEDETQAKPNPFAVLAKLQGRKPS
ncbi:YceD family protein [Variovorax terrae]|uniref:Large ribosomal RNA subunit accumulation protein YceD n=1 Tax=Variovorax terrae TaxID=2923278 RepID=A0A9X1VWM8_9BURK|nr:YceD family protein [Variovorax terrae]MCJ0764310.1 YceD family protein [Variovorax terrae]